MECPRCKVQLHPQKIDEVEVDECPSCWGIWFDCDELRQAKDVLDPDLNWVDFELWKHEDKFVARPDAAKCPHCRTPMCVLKYDPTDVEIHCCASCRGVWTDKDELVQIMATIGEELNGMASKEYLIKVFQEAVEIINGPESLASEWQDFKQVLRLFQLRWTVVERPEINAAIVEAQRQAALL